MLGVLGAVGDDLAAEEAVLGRDVAFDVDEANYAAAVELQSGPLSAQAAQPLSSVRAARAGLSALR